MHPLNSENFEFLHSLGRQRTSEMFVGKIQPLSMNGHPMAAGAVNGVAAGK